jgi:hypothetical protein
MRFHKVVKRLNAHTPGAGDVLRTASPEATST